MSSNLSVSLSDNGYDNAYPLWPLPEQEHLDAAMNAVSPTTRSPLSEHADAAVNGGPPTRTTPDELLDGREDPATRSPLNEHPDTENASPSATRSPPKEWRSWKIKPWWMAILLFTEVALIVATIILERISAGRNGIASVPPIFFYSNSHPRVADIWQYGLLWTTLPSLVMAIYALMWRTAVSGSADRQPFVELRRPRERAANAAITIMLDYGSYPAFYNWIVAWFWKGHILIGFAMLLSLLLSIAIVPLSAHLFVAAPSRSNSTISLSFSTFFNDSALASASIQPSIDLATAILTYRGNPPPWMTAEYAFEEFIADEATLGNVTSNSNAYSAYLDCQAFSPNDTATYGGGDVAYQISDRGCQVSQRLHVVDNTPTYIKSWHTGCGESGYGRIGLHACVYSAASPNKVANLSVISCIPSYWNTSGSLTLSIQPKSSPRFISFTPDNQTLIRPVLHAPFESMLHLYTFFDPSDSISADAFGFSVYNYAKSQNSASPIQPDLIKNSTEKLFATVYAGLANTQLLSRAATPRTAQGTLSTLSTRLFVVTPVAYTVVGVLCLILICNILLFMYSERNHSILYEEPIGLLGNAAVLHGSDVSVFVSEFRERHKEYDMREFVKERYTVKRSKCWFDDEDGNIRIEGLVEKTR